MKQKITLFFADDDPNIRDSAELFWESQEVEAQAFESGTTLLIALRSNSENLPTAVLIDYVMEGGGEELVNTLSKEFPEIPIIVCTGQDIKGSMLAFNLGAYAIMQKPLDLNELHDILKELRGEERIFSQMANDAKSILGFDTSIVWQYDKVKKGYRVAGWSGDLDREFELENTLTKTEYPRIEKLEKGVVYYTANVQATKEYVGKAEAKKRNWVSLVTIPLVRYSRLIGWIDCYKVGKVYDAQMDTYWEGKKKFLKIFGQQASEALHATTLTNQARILHETNQILAGTLDYKLIYETILKKAEDVTGADCGWIYECQPNEGLLKISACFGFDADNADQTLPLEPNTITGMVAIEGVYKYVSDPRYLQEGLQFSSPYGHDIRSILAIPLRRSYRTMGVLKLMSSEIDFFTQEDIQLMTSLAAIAALSMERAKLTEHLSEISYQSQVGTDFDNLAQFVVDAVRDLTDADVNLWMPSIREDEGDDFMRIVKSSKSDKEDNYQDYINTARVPVASGKSLIAEALHKRYHVIVSDLFKHDNEKNAPYYNFDAIKKFNWRSFMTVPLIGKKNESLGAISLYSTHIDRFSEDDGRLIQNFADQAALALQKHRHFKVLQDLTQIGQDLTIGLPGTLPLSKKVANIARSLTKADLTVLYPLDIDDDKYYDRSLCATAGVLRTPFKEITDRPRTNGMAAFVRQHGLLVIEDIAPDKQSMSMKAGKAAVKYEPKSAHYESVLGFVQDSKFIQRENIRAFIGVALTAVEKGSTQKGLPHQDVAVLYINFRAPRRFSEEDLQVLDIFSHQVANIIHRNRLFDSVSRQRKLLESLNRSTLNIMRSQSQEERLQRIIKEAATLLQATGSKMYLTENGSRQDLRLVAITGLDVPELQIGSVMSKKMGMAGKVVRSKKPQMTADYPYFPSSIPALHPYFSAVLEVPMLIGNEVIGTLSVFNDHRTRVFRKKDQVLLQRLADQAALAIFRSRLSDEADALYQTSKQIAAFSDPKELAETILIELQKIIGYDRSSFQVFKSESDTRDTLAFRGEVIDWATPILHRPIGEDELIRPILTHKKPIILENTHKSPLWDKNIKSTKIIRSWVCIPLVFEENVLGIITLDHFIGGYYQQSDAPKLIRFAELAAIALHNNTIELNYFIELQKFASRIANLGTDETVDKIFVDSVNIIEEVFKPIRYRFHHQDEVYFSKRNYFLNKFLTNFENESPKLGQGESLADWAYQQGIALLYPEDFPANMKHIHIAKNTSIFFAPVWRDNKIVGVIEIETIATTYDETRKNFLSTFILQASIAIQKIEQRTRRIEAIQNRFNPYILGNPIREPEQFFGHKQILETILSGINRNNYAVLDERRLGKTSILYRLEYELKYHFNDPKIQYYPVVFNLQGIEYGYFYTLLINKIREAIGQFEEEPLNPSQYGYAQFRRDLDKIKRTLPALCIGKEAVIVLFIDEIDTFNQYPDLIQQQLRNIFVGEKCLRLVLAGVAIKEVNVDTSPWYNFLKREKIGRFSREEAFALITEPLLGICAFSKEAIDAILDKSDSKPMSIQYYCSGALMAMYHRIAEDSISDNATITKEDVLSVPLEKGFTTNTTDHNSDKPIPPSSNIII
jgi:GAF domain-containing protein/DNA-binding response OmpR family regulator